MSTIDINELPHKIECHDLLECLFNLNPLEIRVYLLLQREGPLETNAVAARIDKNRSTAYRCLRQLVSCGIAYKKKETLPRGGYTHCYHVLPAGEVRNIMRKQVLEWMGRMQAAIDLFLQEEWVAADEEE